MYIKGIGTIKKNEAMSILTADGKNAVRNGDITGRVCTFVFWLLTAALAVRVALSWKKDRE